MEWVIIFAVLVVAAYLLHRNKGKKGKSSGGSYRGRDGNDKMR